MPQIKGYAALKAKSSLTPFSFERREPKEHDVVIDIKYCGICHTDIHQTRDEWGGSTFPMVPGHEIVGVISRVELKLPVTKREIKQAWDVLWIPARTVTLARKVFNSIAIME